MSMRQRLGTLVRSLRSVRRHPIWAAIGNLPAVCAGQRYARAYEREALVSRAPDSDNPIWRYFQDHKIGPGIWKLEHYFDVYHRHLARFVGTKVDVLEVGVYSGGSLEMWRSYFGPQCHVHGVDIEPACKAYENDFVSIHIGDQSDGKFWGGLKQRLEGIDVLIDDGGHEFPQQRRTLEEILPWLRPGGVYICEDVCGPGNGFAAYCSGLAAELNSWNWAELAPPFQDAIDSIHIYPWLVVIEKGDKNRGRLTSSKHGTEWQPFLGGRDIPSFRGE